MLIFLMFIFALALVVYKDRKNIQTQGIILMRRTKRGVKWIDKIARTHPRFWNTFAVVSVVIGFFIMIFGTVWLVDNAYKILTGEIEGGAGAVIPYPTGEPMIGMGYVLLPVWLWILAVVIIVFPHEFAHGIVARIENIRIKSLGWLLFLFIPGAFVEPDEKKVKKAKRISRLKIYSVGSFANFCIAGIILVLLLLLSFALHQFVTPIGVTYGGLINGSDAFTKNLTGVIIRVDEKNITTLEEFVDYMKLKSPGDVVEIETRNGNYSIRTIEYEKRAIIGIADARTAYTTDEIGTAILNIHGTLLWIFILVLSVGMVNLLPIKPLDGGMMLEIVLEKITKHSRSMSNFISVLIALLLLFNVIGGYFV